MKLAGFELYRYELPLAAPQTLKGATLHHREGLLLRLTGVDGCEGWGETAPLPGFSDEGLDRAATGLRELAETMVGREATDEWADPEGRFSRELDQLDLNPSVFEQDNRIVSSGLSALEFVMRAERDETLVRTVLGRMGVRRETVNKPVAKLSSGERAKVLLTEITLGDNNLLLLDEPTNYLDIETQDVLLNALEGFPGGILFVSHDRYFVESLATETLTLGIT